MRKYGLLAALGCIVACAPVMEAMRPDPVDLNQFAIGESRINVISALGNAAGNIEDKGNSCDIYKLYINGPDGGGKAVIAVTEAAADVFTLGLTEILFTPVEAATKNAKHTVIFCYSGDGKLVSLNKSDSSTGVE